MRSYAKNVKTVKNENRALVFRYLRHRAMSRAEISRLSGMSKSAVTMITNTLIEEGQIAEIGSADASYGRKPILLDIVADYKYAAGIALHRDDVYVCLTDLESHMMAYKHFPTNRWQDPYVLLDDAYDVILSFLRERNIPFEKCLGIGVSAPGPLDYVSGRILNPPDFRLFHYVDVGDHLRKRSGFPVMVDNNAVLFAMQEYATQAQSRYRNLMFVSVLGGIGSAVLTEGKLFRGFGGFGGELGHTSVHPDGLPCDCGNRGCLERYVSMKALKERFGFEDYERLIDRAYLGDVSARHVIEYIARELSPALVNAVNLFDLDAVIFYGELSYRPRLLSELLHEKLQSRAVLTRTHDVAIVFSKMDRDTAYSSVTAAIVNAYFDQRL